MGIFRGIDLSKFVKKFDESYTYKGRKMKIPVEPYHGDHLVRIIHSLSVKLKEKVEGLTPQDGIINRSFTWYKYEKESGGAYKGVVEDGQPLPEKVNMLSSTALVGMCGGIMGDKNFEKAYIFVPKEFLPFEVLNRWIEFLNRMIPEASKWAAHENPKWKVDSVSSSEYRFPNPYYYSRTPSGKVTINDEELTIRPGIDFSGRGLGVNVRGSKEYYLITTGNNNKKTFAIEKLKWSLARALWSKDYYGMPYIIDFLMDSGMDFWEAVQLSSFHENYGYGLNNGNTQSGGYYCTSPNYITPIFKDNVIKSRFKDGSLSKINEQIGGRLGERPRWMRDRYSSSDSGSNRKSWVEAIKREATLKSGRISLTKIKKKLTIKPKTKSKTKKVEQTW